MVSKNAKLICFQLTGHPLTFRHAQVSKGASLKFQKGPEGMERGQYPSSFRGTELGKSRTPENVGAVLRNSKTSWSISALGQKRTSEHDWTMSALPPKADIGTQSWNVRFVP